MVRKILMAMEDSLPEGLEYLEVAEYDRKAVMYHLKLMTNAKLIEAIDISPMDENLPFGLRA